MDPTIDEGIKKWGLTIVGHFVGFKMSYWDIVGHLKRIWRPYQLDEIIMNEEGLYFIKFKFQDGLQSVIENGPWLVDHKPLFVQRWVAGICLEKPEPARIPLWVTTSMCEKGFGRASFARVLIKVEASKGIVDSVEAWYRKLNGSMNLRVEYAWKPPLCNHCCVFGHSFKGCNNRVLSNEEVKERNEAKNQASGKSGMNMGRGGSNIRGRGRFNYRGGVNGGQVNVENRYVPVKNNVKEKLSDVEGIQEQEKHKGQKNNDDGHVKFIAQRALKLILMLLVTWESQLMMKRLSDLQEYYKNKCEAMEKGEKVLKKQQAEVELFILSDLSISDDVKSRISEMEQHGNENCKRIKTGSSGPQISTGGCRQGGGEKMRVLILELILTLPVNSGP
nr:hypothetical protein [Tanacetum cinerariifolium]